MRSHARRASDRSRAYYVDQYSAITLCSVILLLLACLLDGALTIRILEMGGTEINPLMAQMLKHGELAFVLSKYLLTVVGLPLLLIFKNHYLFGTRCRVGHLLPMFLGSYAALIAYQVVLIQIH